MNHKAFDAETVVTPAGDYEVEWVTDEFPDQPYNEGLGLYISGRRNRVDIDHTDGTPGDLAGVVAEVVGMCQSRDYYDSEHRSGASLVRYLTLRGLKGVTLVDDDYRPVEASADRFGRIVGVAWAPDDATDPVAYVKDSLSEWQAWAEGDVFGYTVTGPDGTLIDSCFGYYGFGREREYTRSQALEAIESHVSERADQANLVGAGIVGII